MKEVLMFFIIFCLLVMSEQIKDVVVELQELNKNLTHEAEKHHD